MSRRLKLERLKNLASGKADMAALRLAAAQALVQKHEAAMRQLNDYLSDYRAVPTVVDAARWRNRRAFVTQLEAAIAQQQIELDKAAGQARHAGKQWQLLDKRTQSLDSIVQRLSAEERKRLDRVEQHATDDLTAELPRARR
jgi:flagellar export protein FliJ